MTRHAKHVRIVEVSPRDGLQNEAAVIPTDAKVDLVRNLVAAGAREVEVGSFVAPKWVPQMASTADVVSAVKDIPGLEGIVLVPNMKGLERAIEAKVKRIAVFPAATEAFSQRNLNASMADSFSRFAEVARAALDAGLKVRGYVSVAFHCPFEGWVDPDAAIGLTSRLLDAGCYEVSICDTTGRATPGHVLPVIEPVVAQHGSERIVAHYHDTFDQGLANALWSWNAGVTAFDASAGGLGGCPYSPGATGNIATESLVHMFDGLGVETGFDLEKLASATRGIESCLGRPLKSAFK
ncbi:MAG: hydroxymethylglutaryl-CoA lyase [Rhizobiales bacterium]|nr:hydroxymethylglutaryl-CoA lyase [Hyphomicrobiales bacterium]MBA68229.1 hydroxymethylglutaryl-CoA lyase [Hyphomicrobiales bacterium]